MSKRKTSNGGGAAGEKDLREQKAPDPRGGPLIGKGRGAPIEDPESPPVKLPPTPDELERETVDGRGDRGAQEGRERGPARE